MAENLNRNLVRQSLFNFLIHPNVWVLIAIYFSLAIYFFSRELTHYAWFSVLGMALLGFLIWTLVEYIIHRFAFHTKIANEQCRKFQFFMHLYHHECPTDPNRLVLPILITLPLSLLTYVLYAWVFAGYGEAVFSGFLLGYLSYDITHYVIHRFKPKTSLGKFLKYYHFYHHFKANHQCFGVSTPLWDYVFNSKNTKPLNK